MIYLGRWFDRNLNDDDQSDEILCDVFWKAIEWETWGLDEQKKTA